MAVKFEQNVDIGAPVEKVWGILSDPTRWPFFISDMDRVTATGAAAEGATYEFQQGNAQGAAGEPPR